MYRFPSVPETIGRNRKRPTFREGPSGAKGRGFDSPIARCGKGLDLLGKFPGRCKPNRSIWLRLHRFTPIGAGTACVDRSSWRCR